ncbi:TonB-dependent hemoglobin/transferrin/lactoferrin family receptor [Thalassospira sp. MA62]|nr:TonB-dependent hemoglobin/transferrin/lactoferrin family receptor [Thalassospira sp. MA62]
MRSDGVGGTNGILKTKRLFHYFNGQRSHIASTALAGVLLGLIPGMALAQVAGGSTATDAPEIAQAELTSATQDYAIAAQDLDGALIAFSRVSGIDVVVNGVLPEQAQSPAIEGSMTPAAALDILISQSNLTWVAVNGTTISIIAPQEGAAAPNGVTLNPIIVTATNRAMGPNGVPDEVYETPGSVSVITQESMRKSPVREARDIFNGVAGVDVSNDARDPGLTVNVRGQQEMGRVNVNIDGARQNYNQLTHGTSSRVYLDPALLAEVEVEKSDLNQNGGAGSSAGIVTMRTLNTDDILDDGEDWGGKVNVSHGTNSYDFTGDTAAGMRVSPKFDVSAAFSRRVIGNYHPGSHNVGLFTTGNGTYHDRDSSRPEYTFLRQTSGLVKANAYLTDNQELNLGYVATMSDYAKTSDVTNELNDFNETETHTLTAKHNWNPTSDLVDLDTGMYWTRTENYQFRPARYSASGTISHNPYYNYYTVDTLGGEIANSSTFDISAIGDGLSTFKLDYGAEYFHDKAKTTSEIEDLGASDDFAYQVEGGTPSGERDVSGGYLTASYGWNDAFSLYGGLRYDRFNLEGDSYWCEAMNAIYGTTHQCGTGNDVPLDIDLEDDKISPSFGMSITPVDGIQLFANYRQNFRAPTIMEAMFKGAHIGGQPVSYFSNANLKAEESETKEIGVNFKFDNVLREDDGLRAKIAYYRSKIENYTTTGFVPLPSLLSPMLPYIGAGMVNLTDPVYINGTEIELSYDAGDYYLGGTFTHTDMDLKGNYNQFILDTTYTAAALSAPDYGTINGLFGIYAPPKRKYTIDGGVRLLDQDLVMGMRASFVYPEENYGGNFSGLSLSTIAGEYFKYRVFDFYSSYDVNDNVSLRFAVNNLFDEAYVQGSGGTYAPAPGRTAIVSLSGNF